MMNSNGTNRTRLPSDQASSSYPHLSGSNPRLSPDGDQIAFEGIFESSSGIYGFGSFVMNSDGTNPIQIANEASPGNADAVFFPSGKG